MKPLKVDELRDVLPRLSELRPILDLLLTVSVPDPDDAWSASGELATVGERLVPEAGFAPAVGTLARNEARHLEKVYEAVAEAIRHLQRDDRPAAAESFLEAAEMEAERQRSDRAAAYAAAAYRVVRHERDQSAASLALRRWGRAARAGGKLDEARVRYVEAFDIAHALGEARAAAEAAIGAGNVLEDQGRREGAEAWYHRALKCLHAVPKPVPEQWHAYLNLHVMLRSRGELEESVSWLDRAAEAAGEISDGSATPFIENAHGQLQLSYGDFEEAGRRFRRALEHTTDPRSTVTVRLNLAESLLAQNRILEAAEHARRAEWEALAGSVTPKLPEVYRLLGRIAATDGRPEAFVLFERALELVEEFRLPELEAALTLQAYGEAETRRGDRTAGDELKERARQLYRTLGIREMRHPWSDVHGPEAEPPRSETE